MKVTQNNAREVWKNIPMQQFCGESEIDWNMKICDVDEQLYKKYSLSKQEVDFIEKTAIGME